MLIKNGLILSPDTGLQTRGDLRITDGIITEIETSGTLTPQPGEQVIDASSYVVAPGLVDIHVHFRDPGLTYKEDIHTGAMAAADRRFYNCHLHGKHKTGRGLPGNYHGYPHTCRKRTGTHPSDRCSQRRNERGSTDGF